jgi:curved DNA-binding protein CbpA
LIPFVPAQAQCGSTTAAALPSRFFSGNPFSPSFYYPYNVFYLNRCLKVTSFNTRILPLRLSDCHNNFPWVSGFIFASMFNIKNYFAILELEPSATAAEIRKAYRRLALIYHPDKKPNDPYANARFTEIKEAYEVLSDPSKKEYYLQQRWYNQSIGKKRTQDTVTPVNLLKQALELEKYVSTLDVFRMDKGGLQEYILELIPDTAIEQLHPFQENNTIREAIQKILKASKALPPAFTSPVYDQLEKLAGTDTAALELIRDQRQKTGRRYRQEKYSLLLIIITTLLLCGLIWLAGR